MPKNDYIGTFQDGRIEMNIEHDKYYLNLWIQQKEAGFSQEIVSKIRFDADVKDDRCVKAFQEIKDWLEANYKMYQYKKDNGVKYGEHELFYWANWETPERYWTIDFNEILSFEKRIELMQQIVKHIESNYSDISGYIYLQYKNCMDWDLANEYILNLDVDYSNVPFDQLRAIFYFQFTGGWKYLNKENANKLIDIQQELFKGLEDKKVVFNGIKGTLKKIDNNGGYGVFKPRATRTYQKIGLNNIISLSAQ